MNDNQRKYPVDITFLHHSVGPDFVNADDITVQDWYSDIGKARGYSNGAINPRHEHPSRPGQLTYAMAQFTLREYTKDGNKYGWRLTDLIARPWQNVAWAVGNWDYNVRSSSIEVCGDYRYKVLPDKALMCVADFLRIIDKELVDAGYAGGVNVWLHNEVFATACPANISNQRATIVDMINNPAKWNAILWPPAPPKPVVTTKEETKTETIPCEKVSVEDATLPKGETKVTQYGLDGVRTIIYTVTYTDGKETARVIKSNTVTQPPVTEITAIGTYEEPPVTPPEDSNPFVTFLTWLLGLIKSIWNK